MKVHRLPIQKAPQNLDIFAHRFQGSWRLDARFFQSRRVSGPRTSDHTARGELLHGRNRHRRNNRLTGEWANRGGGTLILLVEASSAIEVVRESRKQRWSDIQI